MSERAVPCRALATYVSVLGRAAALTERAHGTHCSTGFTWNPFLSLIAAGPTEAIPEVETQLSSDGGQSQARRGEPAGHGRH
jgi:hypothetical protein